MRRDLYTSQDMRWIDLSHPTQEEMAEIQQEFQLHPIFVQDCLDPEHLPKYERTNGLTFIIIRLFDIESNPKASTIQKLTRKVAIFLGPHFIITIHRLENEYFKSLTDKCLTELETSSVSIPMMLVKFLNRSLRTYYIPLENDEESLDSFESSLFERNTDANMFKNLHVVRRRLSLIKRILLHSQDVIQRLSPAGETSSPLFQDLRETTSSLIFLSDELLEDVTSLLGLQISLASQRTNEVMRVLTVFSVFFMPLTFIVGVYGMNFHNMPEMQWEFGYAFAWIVMISTSLAIGIWFRRKGWLNFSE